MNVPQLLIEGQYHESDLDRLKKSVPIWRNSEILESQLAALFDVRFPNAKLEHDYLFQKIAFLKNHAGHNKAICGNWIYFPWDRHLLHTVNRTQFYELMFRKNSVQARPSEQKTLLNSKIGIIGLKLGSDLATLLAHSGIGRQFVLSDPGKAAITSVSENLWTQAKLGMLPMAATCQQLFDTNPYLEIEAHEFPINSDTIAKIIGTTRKPQAIFEFETDLDSKVLIREAAQALEIPVVTALFLNGRFQIIPDRFDIAAKAAFFGGLFGADIVDIKSNPRFAQANAFDICTADSLQIATEINHIASALILGKPETPLSLKWKSVSADPALKAPISEPRPPVLKHVESTIL